VNGLRSLRLFAADLWEESLLFLTAGFLGGVASLLIVPLPFVLAGHYGTAARVADERAVQWADWWAEARLNALFCARWLLLVALVGGALLANLLFYQGIEAGWSRFSRWLSIALLFAWLLPQPFVPALYLRQSDRRLRIALCNAAVLTLADPFSALVVWLAILLLALPLGYTAWPMLLALPVFMAVLSTRLVDLWLRDYPTSP
jgi:hypothetical protein